MERYKELGRIVGKGREEMGTGEDQWETSAKRELEINY
jgi:hypothetical protein